MTTQTKTYDFPMLQGVSPKKEDSGKKEYDFPMLMERREKLSREMEHTKPKPLPTISSEIIDNIGQTTGGIIGGVVTRNPVAGVMMAGLMGGSGKAIQDVYKNLTGDDTAPKASDEALMNVVKAGGEEALWDVAGRFVGNILGKAYHIFRPKVDAGMSELNEIMKRYGGHFTKAQMTSSWGTQQLDSAIRGAIAGKGVFAEVDESIDIALSRWKGALSDDIASYATKNMSNEDFGILIRDTLNDGKTAFKAYVKEMYSGFDDLVKTKIVREIEERPVNYSIVDSTGKPFQDVLKKEVEKEIRPVDLRPLKASSQRLLNRLEEAGDISKTEFGGELIKKINKLDDAVKFSTAQEIRSALLDVQRTARLQGDDKLAGSITKFSVDIKLAMDTAARNQGDDVYEAYQKITKDTRDGYQAFKSKFVTSLLKDDAVLSKTARDLFEAGDPSRVEKLFSAIDQAAKYRDMTYPKQVKDQVRQKYLEHLLNKDLKTNLPSAEETMRTWTARTDVPDAVALSKTIQKPNNLETMGKLFTPEQQQKLLDFTKALTITQAKNKAGLSMLIQLTQGGLVLDAMSGQPGRIAKAGKIFLATDVLAHLLTNPKAIALLTSAAKTPTSLKQSPVIATKIYEEYEKAKAEVEGGKTPSETLIEYGKSFIPEEQN